LTLIAPDSGEIVVEHASGRHAEKIKGRRVALGEGITGWVIANQKPFCNTDPRLDFPPTLAENFQDYQTLASFPLLKGDHLYGALTVYSSKFAEYSSDQQKLLKESAAVLTNSLSTTSQPTSGRGTEEVSKGTPNQIGFSADSALPPGTGIESELTH